MILFLLFFVIVQLSEAIHFVHIHIPKTFGTILCDQWRTAGFKVSHRIHNCVHPKDVTDWCCSIFADEKHATCDQRKSFDATMIERFVELDENNLIKKCADTKYSIFLRHPLQRIISHLRHFCEFRPGLMRYFKSNKAEVVLQLFKSIDVLSIDQLKAVRRNTSGLWSYEDLYRLRQFTNNFAVRMLSQRGRERSTTHLTPVTESDYNIAVENLKKIDLVLTDDRLKSVCAERLLQDHFNNHSIKFDFIEEKRWRSIFQFPILPHHLIESNVFDIKLYWYARSALMARCPSLSFN